MPAVLIFRFDKAGVTGIGLSFLLLRLLLGQEDTVKKINYHYKPLGKNQKKQTTTKGRGKKKKEKERDKNAVDARRSAHNAGGGPSRIR